MTRFAKDFCTLFNVLWYRDFPLEYGVKELGRRAEWTTHIAICVRSAADLLGYFTHFEAGTRTDAVIKDAAGRPLANVEWEWTQPRAKGFNELEKLHSGRDRVEFSALITYSRDEHHDENLKLLKKQWGNSEQLLLAFFIRFGYRKGRRFGDLETYTVQRGKVTRVRSQPALPWARTGTRWEMVGKVDGQPGSQQDAAR
jgi:hypothetical protein